LDKLTTQCKLELEGGDLIEEVFVEASMDAFSEEETQDNAAALVDAVWVVVPELVGQNQQ